MNIFWFRRDLRLDDNVGLFHALSGDSETLPIFIFDEAILNELPKNDARLNFIHQSLNKINDDFSEKNKSTKYRNGTVWSLWKKEVLLEIPILENEELLPSGTNTDEPSIQERKACHHGLSLLLLLSLMKLIRNHLSSR